MFRDAFLRVAESSFLKTVLKNKICPFSLSNKNESRWDKFASIFCLGSTIFSGRMIGRFCLSNIFFPPPLSVSVGKCVFTELARSVEFSSGKRPMDRGFRREKIATSASHLHVPSPCAYYWSFCRGSRGLLHIQNLKAFLNCILGGWLLLFFTRGFNMFLAAFLRASESSFERAVLKNKIPFRNPLTTTFMG